MNYWRNQPSRIQRSNIRDPGRAPLCPASSVCAARTVTPALLWILSVAFGSDAVSAERPPEPVTPARGPQPTIQSVTQSGPYRVNRYREQDGLRNGPRYRGATVYYPVDGPTPFASIVIVPGYISRENSIRAWGPFYASHGIVAMTIGTNRLQDDPAARRRALLDAITSLKLENRRPNSPLNGRLAESRFAVSGWSMGGGGALEAATRAPDLKAVVALCPWNPYRTFSHRVPVLFLAGQRDRLAPVADNALRHYDKTPATTPKLYFEVRDEGHWIANTPQGGQGAIGRLALSWLKVYLEDDVRYRRFLLQRPATASRFHSNFTTNASPRHN
ncbi:MAG: triacylglycerol lipase [Planctomycetaceae bacterium]|nr:triacylglycerol lipase [Planctomycetaceae bacterium]